jgi:MFS family permease
MQTQSTANPKPTKGALIFILGVVLIDIIGLTMLTPVSAYIVREYSADALSVTMLTVIYAAAQFLAAPLLGRLSDRYGRRPVLLVCVFGSAVGYFVFGIGGALWVLFLSRLIDGVTGGNLSVANAYIADVTPPQDRAKSFALVGAAFGLGFVLGPAIGGGLSQISLAAPAYAAGILSLLNVLFGFFALRESLPEEKRDRHPLRLQDANPLASISEFARRPTLGILLLVYVLFYFAFNGRNAIFSVFAIDTYDVTPAQLAILFVVSGIGNIVVQGFLVGRLAPRFGEKALVGFSLMTQALMFMATYLVPMYWMQYPVSVLATATAGLLWPTLTALIANAVSQDEQGRISGVTTSLGGLMSVVGPLWAGAAYDQISHASPFWTGALLLVVAWLLLLRVRRQTTVVEKAFEAA